LQNITTNFEKKLDTTFLKQIGSAILPVSNYILEPFWSTETSEDLEYPSMADASERGAIVEQHAYS